MIQNHLPFCAAIVGLPDLLVPQIRLMIVFYVTAGISGATLNYLV